MIIVCEKQQLPVFLFVVVTAAMYALGKKVKAVRNLRVKKEFKKNDYLRRYCKNKLLI